MTRGAAGKQLSSQRAAFFVNMNGMSPFGRHPGHVQTARTAADHHDFFGVLRGDNGHLFFTPQHWIDQTFNAAFSEDGFHAGIAGNAGPDFIQAALAGFVGHFRIGQQPAANTHQVGLAV